MALPSLVDPPLNTSDYNEVKITLYIRRFLTKDHQWDMMKNPKVWDSFSGSEI